jgi:hypothetical protein
MELNAREVVFVSPLAATSILLLLNIEETPSKSIRDCIATYDVGLITANRFDGLARIFLSMPSLLHIW